MRAALCLVMAAVVAGCGTTSGLSATESRSGFDGARIVDIAPHGTACTTNPCISLGAQWNSKVPTQSSVIVRLSGNKFLGITRLELSVDGTESRFMPGSTPTNFSSSFPPMRDSFQSFAVPTATLRAVAQAKRAWVRVHTTEGFIEAAVVDGAEDSKALHALRRFLAQVGEG